MKLRLHLAKLITLPVKEFNPFDTIFFIIKFMTWNDLQLSVQSRMNNIHIGDDLGQGWMQQGSEHQNR